MTRDEMINALKTSDDTWLQGGKDVVILFAWEARKIAAQLELDRPESDKDHERNTEDRQS